MDPFEQRRALDTIRHDLRIPASVGIAKGRVVVLEINQAAQGAGFQVLADPVVMPRRSNDSRMNARIATAVPCGSKPLHTTANWPAQTRGR